MVGTMPKKVLIEEVVIDGVTILMKECTKCKKIKPLDTEYDDYKNTSYGKYPSCRDCRKEHYHANQDTVQKYRRENRDKLIAKSKKYREENKDKVKQTNAAYKEAHKQEISDNRKKYYRENKERLLDYSKQRWSSYYYEENKESLKLNNQKRRALLRELPNDISEEEVQEILTRFNNKCALSDSTEYHLDHFIALSTGHVGTVKQNMIPLSPSLNKSKHARNPFEWVKSRDDINEEKFNQVVKYLANLNCLSVQEFTDFVYKCYENPMNASTQM